jgi:hypothetical protein
MPRTALCGPWSLCAYGRAVAFAAAAELRRWRCVPARARCQAHRPTHYHACQRRRCTSHSGPQCCGAQGLAGGAQPRGPERRRARARADIVHCHDWATAPVAFGDLAQAAPVFTIHNLNYGADLIGRAVAASAVATTVSPTYAAEARRPRPVHARPRPRHVRPRGAAPSIGHCPTRFTQRPAPSRARVYAVLKPGLDRSCQNARRRAGEWAPRDRAAHGQVLRHPERH